MAPHQKHGSLVSDDTLDHLCLSMTVVGDGLLVGGTPEPTNSYRFESASNRPKACARIGLKYLLFIWTQGTFPLLLWRYCLYRSYMAFLWSFFSLWFLSFFFVVDGSLMEPEVSTPLSVLSESTPGMTDYSSVAGSLPPTPAFVESYVVSYSLIYTTLSC